jgi:preprotein translocase subunit Sss1
VQHALGQAASELLIEAPGGHCVPLALLKFSLVSITGEKVMPSLEEHIVQLIMTVVGSSLLGLIGFVWKISHKVSFLQKEIEAQKELHRRDIQEVRRDIDMIISKVDKQGEWTTNRMMSFAKDLK